MGCLPDAQELAHQHGRKVALSLSDAFCVDRHRAEFLNLIRSGVDIVFANENEIKSLYETQTYDGAAAHARRDIKLAVLTRSAKGSHIFSEGHDISISADPVAKVVDTTGAGDLYAAGFLFGTAKGLPLETCGKLASLAAAEVISHIGARPATPLDQLARQKGLIS